MSETTLVLGGGGVAGIAWMTGLLLGLRDEGIDLRAAARLIGTSAGATVAAQLGSDVDLEALFERQVDPALQAAELAPDRGLLREFNRTLPPLMEIADPIERGRRVGALAVEAATVDEAARRAVIAERLPSHAWPSRPLQIVAIDIASGETMVFERNAGVALVDAVAASCAVPGVWPPVTIGARRYMDGGVRSSDNADLAGGGGSVVVISPRGAVTPVAAEGLRAHLRLLEERGAQVRLVEPDEASREAIGTNPLSPETRTPAATAGRRQGQSLAASFRDFAPG